jgi:hypothetical protein
MLAWKTQAGGQLSIPSTNEVIANAAIEQAPQAVVYVPNDVPEDEGTQNLQALGLAAKSAHLTLMPVGASQSTSVALTSVALFDQGLLQVLQASASGLEPNTSYVLRLSRNADGSGNVEALAMLMTNAAVSAIVDAIGQIRQVVMH